MLCIFDVTCNLLARPTFTGTHAHHHGMEKQWGTLTSEHVRILTSAEAFFSHTTNPYEAIVGFRIRVLKS